jgi:hypothetical protein
MNAALNAVRWTMVNVMFAAAAMAAVLSPAILGFKGAMELETGMITVQKRTAMADEEIVKLLNRTSICTHNESRSSSSKSSCSKSSSEEHIVVITNSKIENIIRNEINNLPPQAQEDIDLSDIKIWKPVGCKKCGKTGFKGRVGIFEALEMTDEMSELVLEDQGEQPIKRQAFKQGMITMRQDGIMKALEGKTSVEVVLKATKETKKK